MIKIYGTENSRAVRPIWTAEEMGLEYELIMMPFPPRILMNSFPALISFRNHYSMLPNTDFLKESL